MQIRDLITACLAICTSKAALAQHPVVLERLTSWNAAAPIPAPSIIISETTKAAALIQKQKGECVATTSVIESVLPVTGIRYVMEGIATGRLRNGWTITARHPNCGTEVSRYLITQGADDRLDTFRMNKGKSNANESLIGDTLLQAILAAQIAITRSGTKCQSENATLGTFRIAEQDVRLGPEIFGVRYVGSWSEVWPITTCGKTAEVLIRFTADGDGGAFQDIKGKTVKVLPEGK